MKKGYSASHKNRRVPRGLLAIWLVLHLGGTALLGYLDTPMRRSLISHKSGVHAHLVLGLLLAAVHLFVLLRVKDPGFVPRSNETTLRGTGMLPGPVGSGMPLQPCSTEAVEDSGVGICASCKLVQAVRVKHCKRCGHCVLGYDHHCHWLGTCIGHQNKLHFFIFLVVEWSLCLAGLHNSLSAIRFRQGHWHWQQGVALASFFVMFACLLFISSMLVYQTYLILVNQTSYESHMWSRVPYLKPFKDHQSPFSRGPLTNFWNFICQSPEYNMMVPQHTSTGSTSSCLLWENQLYSCC